MEIFEESLVFEIPESRYAKILIFGGSGEVSNYKVSEKNP